MNGSYSSTTIDHNYETLPPLRTAIDKYRKKKMSEITWRKVRDLWDYQTQSEWVVSGTSMYDDYLGSHPKGMSKVGKISQDMEMKKEYYAI
jgi:hypothetical protein